MNNLIDGVSRKTVVGLYTRETMAVHSSLCCRSTSYLILR